MKARYLDSWRSIAELTPFPLVAKMQPWCGASTHKIRWCPHLKWKTVALYSPSKMVQLTSPAWQIKVPKSSHTTRQDDWTFCPLYSKEKKTFIEHNIVIHCNPEKRHLQVLVFTSSRTLVTNEWKVVSVYQIFQERSITSPPSPISGARVPWTFGTISGLHACMYVYLAWKHNCLLFSCVSGKASIAFLWGPNH